MIERSARAGVDVDGRSGYDASMRTTIDVNDDLMRHMKERARSSGRSLKDVINDTLRLGLKAQQRGDGGRRYRCPEFSLGAPTTYNLDKALELAGDLESEEIARKLRLRK